MSDVVVAKPRPPWPALLLGLLVMGPLSVPGMGFLVLGAMPLLGALSLYAAWTAWRRPARRRRQLQNAVIWIAALALYAGAHAWYAAAARRSGEDIVAAVERQHATHGQWPRDLEAVAVSEEQRRRFLRWGGHYDAADGTPFARHDDTFVFFVQLYFYDFEQRRWIHDPG